MRRTFADALKPGDTVICRRSSERVVVDVAEVRVPGGWVVIDGHEETTGRYRTFWHTEVDRAPRAR